MAPKTSFFEIRFTSTYTFSMSNGSKPVFLHYGKQKIYFFGHFNLHFTNLNCEWPRLRNAMFLKSFSGHFIFLRYQLVVMLCFLILIKKGIFSGSF